ncbi:MULTISPECIES: DUF4436 family protein [unclassified Streptomyces]|uniref:DUF4436 family protein n=1 Tax=Streptomyces TaxID=1883 RepID=UPI001FD0386C|nr:MULTISPECIES: DUF4436 family protein [unclassified Streptomyces]MCZ4103588.1 DUF4436 family protein [Streptomyces sp. H39-C1]
MAACYGPAAGPDDGGSPATRSGRLSRCPGDNGTIKVHDARTGTSDIAALDIGLACSNGVLVLAAFMMIAMWALAVSLLIGRWFLGTRRKDLAWPVRGWMAAQLIALAVFRNTAPGTPPFGCLAFLWRRPIIAFCLITVVVMGRRAEPRTDRPVVAAGSAQ